jgi:ATP-dependent DNA helicase DinG
VTVPDFSSESLSASELVAQTAAALAPAGLLAEGDPGYIWRSGQAAMAEAVARAIDDRSALVAEAGTGIGKTYAYLVPLLLSGRRALVSTATKSLQDQLFLRDLPRLKSLLRISGRHALLKGRGSYLCLHRLELARPSDAAVDRFTQRALALIERWAVSTTSGDLAELDGLDERSPIIPLVTSTRENCLGTECPQFAACHVVRARREALAADLVVVNHHLFFADLALRDSGMGELLPTVDAVVFDEAHQIVETGVQFLGRTIASGQCLDFARDMLAAGLQHARGLQPWAERAAACEYRARDLRIACAARADRDDRDPDAAPTPVAPRLRWEQVSRRPTFEAALAALADALADARAALEAVAETSPDLARLAQRAGELAAQAHLFRDPPPTGRVRWVDISPHSVRLVESPLDLRDALTPVRAASPRAWIFTSATLGDDDAMTSFVDSAGLADAQRLKVPSPFDYPRHARLWVSRDFPRPADPGHAAAVARLAARCATRLHGRTFVLTTTRRAVQAVSQALRTALDGRIEVLVQGDSPRRQLLERFAQGASILVGSHSFWEGIDMPGRSLQCVVIDKLPFPPPDDPLVEARSLRLKAEGRDPFTAYSLSEAALLLKQGAGRLIRTETDTGLLAICDPRLKTMGYGRRLIAALPPMTLVESEAEALAWLEQIASAADEP